MSKLPDLPDNKDEYWEGADVKGGIVPEAVSANHHSFIKVAGNEVQCTDCHWGFSLDTGDVLKSGHIYNSKGELIV